MSTAFSKTPYQIAKYHGLTKKRTHRLRRDKSSGHHDKENQNKANTIMEKLKQGVRENYTSERQRMEDSEAHEHRDFIKEPNIACKMLMVKECLETEFEEKMLERDPEEIANMQRLYQGTSFSEVQLTMDSEDFIQLYEIYNEEQQDTLSADISLQLQARFSKSYTLDVAYHKQELLNSNSAQIERLVDKIFHSIFPGKGAKSKRKLMKKVQTVMNIHHMRKPKEKQIDFEKICYNDQLQQIFTDMLNEPCVPGDPILNECQTALCHAFKFLSKVFQTEIQYIDTQIDEIVRKKPAYAEHATLAKQVLQFEYQTLLRQAYLDNMFIVLCFKYSDYLWQPYLKQ